MITNAILKVINGKNLECDEVKIIFEQITDGKATDAQLAAFLTAFRIKGETVQEITAAAQVMKKKCIPLNVNDTQAIDIIGTGGDCSNTFNISTAAAFIAAGAGAHVTKHGNRSVSSKSGAADVLEALGANINLKPEDCLKLFKKTAICFLFAQNYHPCMKYVADVRKQIATRTIFNILGPLINPANAKMQLIGVYDKNLTEPVARVLINLNVTDGMVIHGADGLDEATITSDTIVSEIRNSKIKTYTIKPEDFGLNCANMADIQGGNPNENAKIILDILSGKENGPKCDIAALNAGLALYITKKADTIKDGIILAKTAINNGLALRKLEEFISLSNSF